MSAPDAFKESGALAYKHSGRELLVQGYAL